MEKHAAPNLQTMNENTDQIDLSTAATALPDRALRASAEDFLNREVFAEALAGQILHAPAGQTLRLGVYGGWGEGKTSVLELMRLRLKAAGQVCAWITPWTATTREEVMGQIVDQLREQLEIDAKSLKRARGFARFAGATTTAAKDATWWSKAAAQLFAPAVHKRFEASVARESERFFEVVQEQLGGRRIIIFIDDIDRVKPEFVPDLLLTLREALDQPNFFYVMALAPEIVERGLAMVHHGWGTAGDFLEKIVEYPRYLPDPTDAEIEVFIRKSVALLGDAIDATVVRQLIPLLPRNPRKLKLYLRLMASLRGLLRRFDPAEIDLHMLYTVQLLRSEFADEVRRITTDEQALEDLERGQIRDLMNAKASAKTTNAPEEEPPPRPSDKYMPQAATVRKERFDELYRAVRVRDVLLRGSYPLASLFTLPDDPPLFTWKELNVFVPRFAAAQGTSRRSLLDAEVMRDGVLNPYRADAFFRLTLEMRGAALGQASESHLDRDRAEVLDEVATLTDILELFIRDLRGFAQPFLPVTSWKGFLAQAQRWSHFSQPDDYVAVRRRERDLLALGVATMADELRPAALDHLGPSIDFVGSESEDFRALVAELRRVLQIWAVDAILQHFGEPDGLEGYWGDRGSSGMKEVLFNPDSPLYLDQASRAAFDALGMRATTDPIVQRNFVQFARMLLYGATEGGSFGRDQSRRIITNEALMKIVWTAAVATPLNPRTAGGLRERRTRLLNEQVIDQAYAERVFVLPQWWRVLEVTFFVS